MVFKLMEMLKAPTRKVLLMVQGPNDTAVPVQQGELGGGGGSSGSSAATATYPPQVLVVGAAEVGLTVPTGANRALVTVTAGTARIGLGAAATAAVYPTGGGVEISGAQLATLRLIREGGSDATVRVDYWRVG